MRVSALLAAAVLASAGVSARADEMFAWEKVAERTVRAERLPARQAGQAMDMVRAAIDDAVNASAPFGGGPSADIAAAVAAHDVLVKLFPTRRAALDARLEKVSVKGIDDSVIEAAALSGHQAAATVLAADWNWRRPAIPSERAKRLPPLKELSLPLHPASSAPLQAGPRKPDRL